MKYHAKYKKIKINKQAQARSSELENCSFSVTSSPHACPGLGLRDIKAVDLFGGWNQMSQESCELAKIVTQRVPPGSNFVDPDVIFPKSGGILTPTLLLAPSPHSSAHSQAPPDSTLGDLPRSLSLSTLLQGLAQASSARVSGWTDERRSPSVRDGFSPTPGLQLLSLLPTGKILIHPSKPSFRAVPCRNLYFSLCSASLVLSTWMRQEWWLMPRVPVWMLARHHPQTHRLEPRGWY